MWAGFLLREKKWVLLPIVVLSVVAYSIWRFQSPYPAPLNWDMWEHQTIINHILQGQFALLPSALSDTFRFNGYTTLFHVLIAGVQKVFQPDILGFWWFADYFLLLTSALATTALMYRITKRVFPTLVAGVFSLFFFESSVVYATLLFMPQTVVAVLWVLALTTLMSCEKRSSAIWLILCSAFILIPMHFIVGAAGVLLLIAYRFLEETGLTKRVAIFITGMLTLPVILYFGFARISNIFHLESLNFGEATAFTQTLAEKLTFIQTWYGFFPLIFLPISIYEVVKTEKTRTLWILLTLIIGVVSAPFPYAMKFYTLGRYLTIIFMASGVSMLTHKLTNFSGKIIILGCITIATAVLFYTNIWSWQLPLVFRSQASYVSSDEYNASKFLVDHYNKTTTFIVSDPSTQSIMEALTGIESQGGVYMNTTSRLSISQAFDSQTPNQFIRTITTITDTIDRSPKSIYLVVVSARLFQWLDSTPQERSDIAYNIWGPQSFSLEDRSHLTDLVKTFQLKTVYKNESLAIVEIKGNL